MDKSALLLSVKGSHDLLKLSEIILLFLVCLILGLGQEVELMDEFFKFWG